MTEVADQGVRDDIARCHDRTLFVEAGAGTGKTTSLVARVVELIRSGVPIDDLAVITFTEAAAAELRDRIRRELDVAAPTPEIHAALAGLDAAAISTLHGFAQRILSENPLEAGLPPLVEVHSEIGAQVEFEHRWRRFLDELLDDPAHAELIQRAVVAGIELRHLKGLARILEDQWDRLPADDAHPAPLGPLRIDDVVDAVADAVTLRDLATDPSDRMAERLAGRVEWLAGARAADTDVERLAALVADRRFGGRIGNKGNWPDGVLDEVRSHLARAQEAADATTRHAIDEVLRHLLVHLGRFTRRGVEERRAAGRLHFHDLLVMARDLLRTSEPVRRRLHERYRFLLIDEFQDTDPIQIEIARLIACPDPEAARAHWSQIPTAPGRLFFVGDAKQAIYRFRRADIRLFLQVRDDGIAEERVLSTNFRTVPGIVDWVNHTFDRIMGPGVPQAQPAYNALQAHRAGDDAFAGPPVAVLGGPLELKATSDRRRVMGDDLALALHQAMSDAWRVHDPRAGGWRAPRWSDIAILVPARTGLPELRAAFDRADIPYRIEASSLVWLTQEVRDLLSVLRAVDDPTDSLALVATLRSPAFGCGDDDLARFVAAGGRLELGRTPPEGIPADDPVADGLTALAELHDAAIWDEPSALVERVLRDRHLMELAAASPRPRDVWRRLRFVADQARAYADAEGGTLRDFLAWTDLQADESARVSETILPETDDDAVRVLTIHASKGLEYPIVALAGLDRKPVEARPGPTILFGDDDDMEAHLRDVLSTSGFAPLKAVDDDHEGYEAWRLMYVAATRARDHLVLCVHHQAGADPQKNVAARLHELCLERPELWRPLVPAAAPRSTGPRTTTADTATIADPAARTEWIARRQAMLDHLARPSVVAATAVAGLAVPPTATERPAPEPSDHDDDDGPWRRGRAGTSIGRAVHATLQTVDLATGDAIDAIAAAQATAEGVPDRAREVAASARAALAAPVVAAAAQGRHWKELYLGTTIEGVLCEGYIDLLVETDDGLHVVDYKTDRAPDPTALADRYRLQAATYALLVEQALQRQVARCVLVVLGPHRAEEVLIEDLEAATSEVRRLLRERARPLSLDGRVGPGPVPG